MSSFGRAFKKIHSSRNIKQSQLADGLFDRSTISKIETTQHETSYERAITLISRLGITPNEFEYIKNDYNLNLKDEIIYEFNNFICNSEDDKISNLLKKCSSLQKDSRIQKIQTVLEAIQTLNHHGDLTQAKKIVQPIWENYLSNIELWTVMDLHLLRGILFFFTPITMHKITDMAIKTIDDKYPFLKSLKLSFLLSQSTLEMQNSNINVALPCLTKAACLAEELSKYDKLLFIDCRIAICNDDQQNFIKYSSLLKNIGANKLAVKVKREGNTFAGLSSKQL